MICSLLGKGGSSFGNTQLADEGKTSLITVEEAVGGFRLAAEGAC
jgi:hypothetical protein